MDIQVFFQSRALQKNATMNFLVHMLLCSRAEYLEDNFLAVGLAN